VLALSGSENLKICCLDFWVFFDCTFLDNFKPRTPEKPHDAEKACNTKDFEYPYGANPLYCRLS